MLTKETTKVIKVAIIRNPNVTTNDLDVKFDVPQQLGGLKREITVKRNNLKNLTNIMTYSNLSKKLGISVYALTRFLNKETNNPINSDIIYDVLDSIDFNQLKAEQEGTFGGLNKMNIRYKFFEAIAKTKKLKGNFFTLPSNTCAFENELNINLANKFHYVGAEHDQEIFLEALQTIAKYKLRMSLNLSKAKDILANKPSEFFAHIFADYCGTFPSFENEIRNIFTNNLVRRGGLIGLTFSTREANTKNQTSIEYHKAILDIVGSKDTPSTIGGIKLKLMSFMGKSYTFEEIIDYNDKGGHMVFVLIKRIG